MRLPQLRQAQDQQTFSVRGQIINIQSMADQTVATAQLTVPMQDKSLQSLYINEWCSCIPIKLFMDSHIWISCNSPMSSTVLLVNAFQHLKMAKTILSARNYTNTSSKLDLVQALHYVDPQWTMSVDNAFWCAIKHNFLSVQHILKD